MSLIEASPYYDDGQITIYCAKTLPTLTALTDAGVRADLIMADPPYGETSIEWDRWEPEFPSAAAAITKPGGTMWCFGSMRMFMQNAADFAKWRFAQDVIWEKHNGASPHTDRFRKVHEVAVHFCRAGDRWSDVYKCPQFTQDATKRATRRKERPTHFGKIEGSTYISEDGGPRRMRSVLYARSCHGHAEHPTQKPVEVVRPLIAFSLKPGGTLVVPYMGSGTDVVIARDMDARVIAIEGQEQYCEVAVKRLKQEAQLELAA